MKDDLRLKQLRDLIEQVKLLQDSATALIKQLTDRIERTQADSKRRPPRDRRRKPRS